jgi:Tol biopolymer transport system component
VSGCGAGTQSTAGTGAQSDFLRHEADASWDVTKPRGATRDVDFETSEGTWMSVDASSDGRWLVFDLMGHIYRLPAAGGRAECLTENSGIALNYHPRFSSDGKRIAFVSDRAGQANLWVMNADGSNVRPVFLDPISRMVSPAWTPDGAAILAVREFPTYEMHRRSARIWRFPVDRPGEVAEQLVGAKSGFQAYWPAPSPDGKSFYFMWTSFAGPLMGYVREQHLRRYDFATHGHSLVTVPFGERGYHPGTNADLAPEASPDGRWVAFARRVQGGSIKYRGHQYNARTALWLRELATGREHVLIDPITLDMQGAHGMKNLAVLPGYAWNKDSQSLVMWNAGKLSRVDLSGERHEIPFVARIHRVVSEQARWNHGIGADTLHSQNIRWPTLSEPAQKLVFEAVGEIWTAPSNAAQAKATPLAAWSPDAAYYMPAVSPDGRRVAFVSWNDYRLGAVLTCELAACSPRAASSSDGLYLYPTWSPSGDVIYALRARTTNAANIASAGGRQQQFELVELGPKGERVILATAPDGQISVGPDGRIYMLNYSGIVDTQVYLTEGKTFPVVSANLTSLDPAAPGVTRAEAKFPRATSAAPSPDGRQVGFVEGWEAFVAPLMHSTSEYAHGEENDWEGPQRPFSIVKEDPADGAFAVSFGGANTLRWIDSHRVIYALGQKVHIYDTIARHDRVVTVDAAVPRAVPGATQTVALTGARIITLGKAGVIENGSIIVKGSRITCVGTCAVAGAMKTYDLAGKTVTAGFTDVHAHGEWPDFRSIASTIRRPPYISPMV